MQDEEKETTNMTKRTSEFPVQKSVICKLLHESLQRVLEKDSIFSSLLSKELSQFLENDFPENVKELFYKLLCEKVKLKNSEKFYSTFYESIMLGAADLVPGVTPKYSRVFLMKFAELLSAHVNKKQEVVAETSQSISEKELTGLQYLGGYVIHKLYKKFKTSKNWKNKDFQDAIAILEACRGAVDHQKLIQSLDRGGLWGISNAIQKLFVLVEKYFRTKTVQTSLRSINIKNLVKELMNFSYVKDFYSEVLASTDITPTDEVAKSTLLTILTLYLRVRSFSYARDFVQKYRLSKSLHKNKALRKEIHRSVETHECQEK